MINFIVWLIVGGIIGWLASIVMHHPEGLLMNILVGIVGAFLGGWFLAPLVGTSTINQGNFSPLGLLVSLLGALILVAILTLFQRSRVR